MQQPRLLTRLREAIRVRHYSYQTEKAYVHWVRRYIRFHGLRHPDSLSGDQVRSFLTHLAVEKGVSASTQNQALCAIIFLYRHVSNRILVGSMVWPGARNGFEFRWC